MLHQLISPIRLDRVVCLVILSFYSFSATYLSGQNSVEVQELFIRATVMESLNRDSAIQYWTAEYSSTGIDEDLDYKGHVALILSKAYNGIRQCDSIEYWNRQAQTLYDNTGNRRGLGEVMFQDGYHAFCLIDYEQALEHTLQGLAIMEELNDNEGIALGHLRMSRIFHFTAKLTQSAEYGLSAGERFEKAGDHINSWDSWSFTGHALRMQEDSLGAIQAFNKGLAAAERSMTQSIMGMAYNDLAAFYMEWDRYSDAETFFIKSLDIANPSDERQIMVIRNGLSQVYLHTGRYEQCIEISKQALKTVYKINDLFFLTELPEYIAKSYEGLQQYDSAYKYMKLNWTATDSLFTVNQEQTLEEMRTKYETAQKESTIALQGAKLNQQKWVLVLVVGILLISFIAGIVLLRLNRALQKRQEEKDFLMKEIHHRVKNNLQILSSLLSLQSDDEDNIAISGALQESRNRVESMGLIHQKLYTKDNLTAINMNEYVAELCEHLSDSFRSDEKEITIRSDIRVGLTDVETAIPLGLIINELITNSMKYAFKNKESGKIMVRLWEQDGQRLELVVADNGKPADEEANASSSTRFGSRLINILSKKLKGTIEVNHENGYKTSLTFERYLLTKSL